MKGLANWIGGGAILALVLTISFISHAAPGACADPDGDGWGWNGVDSCKVASSQLSSESCIDDDGDGWGWNGIGSCRSVSAATLNAGGSNTGPCVDPDGDGWGWDGSGSCRSSGATRDTGASNSAACIDQDGDGWGWNGSASCRTSQILNNTSNNSGHSLPVVQNSSIAENCDKLRTGNYHITELVTDVILTAGQSNATGGNTKYLPDTHREDRTNNRVLVWTVNNRWEVANPRYQTWHNEIYPSGKGRIQNHPAFQIGRAIADQDECRVVALVATAASGMPIDHWRNNQDDHFTYISDRVTSALNALPSYYKVDMIWWMQGEADNDQNVNRYFYKLNDLIAKFRGESWFQTNGYFLANETGWFSYANEAIGRLKTDNNRFTDYSRGEDRPSDPFPHIATDPLKVHFNEVALRKIGNLVARKYINEYVRNR